jgi:GAF domain-containing protein
MDDQPPRIDEQAADHSLLNGQGFPQVARLELDELLDELIARARDVQATQGRLRGLLRANLGVARAVDLEESLRHLVAAARELVGARYAGLGVLDQGRIVRFLHTGMDAARIEAIGHVPDGKGLLGRLIDCPEPLRLADLQSDPSSVGFPGHHAPMRSFLGVPVRVGTRVFGNLYLTDKDGADAFSTDDEELVVALAAAAGVAIDNATLFDESCRRQRWQVAMASLSTALLTSDADEALPHIVHQLAGTLDATGASICVPAGGQDELQVAATVGVLTAWEGDTVPTVGTLYADAKAATTPIVVPDALVDQRTAHRFAGRDIGPCAAVALRSGIGFIGILFAIRRRGETFDRLDVELLDLYARHAALVVQLVQARQDNEHLRLTEDRHQIALDLQDRVVNHLFGLGCTWYRSAERVHFEDRRDRRRYPLRPRCGLLHRSPAARPAAVAGPLAALGSGRPRVMRAPRARDARRRPASRRGLRGPGRPSRAADRRSHRVPGCPRP